MRKPFKHLSLKERERLFGWKKEGLSLREIAKRLGREPSTLSRELKRNAPPIRRGYYLPAKAQVRALKRCVSSRTRTRLRNPALRRYILRKLRQDMSPEQIAGRLKAMHSKQHISHEAIYQFIYAEARDLIPLLARSHRKRLPRRHTKKHRKSHIPQRVPIAQRPSMVEDRRQFGHWESDTAISRVSLQALLVMVERKSRLVKLALLPRKSAEATRIAINRRLSQLPTGLRRTITYDNGSENVEHMMVNETVGTKSYFCNPFHSWEKGTVENTVGLVRRYFPKKTDFGTIRPDQVQRVEMRINNRPRKCLNFRTPLEVYRSGVALTG